MKARSAAMYVCTTRGTQSRCRSGPRTRLAATFPDEQWAFGLYRSVPSLPRSRFSIYTAAVQSPVQTFRVQTLNTSSLARFADSFNSIFDGTDTLLSRMQTALCAENGSAVSYGRITFSVAGPNVFPSLGIYQEIAAYFVLHASAVHLRERELATFG